MRVLGISPLDKDSTVSFMDEGRVVFACGEERLSRVKLQDGFPHRALKAGLEQTRWDPASIDTVAYAFFDGDEEARLIEASVAADLETSGRAATAASIQRLGRLLTEDYEVDRRRRIPGFDDVANEFVPKKSALKRSVYRAFSSSAALDHAIHRRYLRRWADSAAADHRARTR